MDLNVWKAVHKISALFQMGGQMLVKMGALSCNADLAKIQVYSNAFNDASGNDQKFSKDDQIDSLFASAYKHYDCGDAISTGEDMGAIAERIVSNGK